MCGSLFFIEPMIDVFFEYRYELNAEGLPKADPEVVVLYYIPSAQFELPMKRGRVMEKLIRLMP